MDDLHYVCFTFESSQAATSHASGAWNQSCVEAKPSTPPPWEVSRCRRTDYASVRGWGLSVTR